MTSVTPELLEGVHNMLETCGGLTAGDRLLLITEAGDRDHYWPCARAAVLACADDIRVMRLAGSDFGGRILAPEAPAQV